VIDGDIERKERGLLMNRFCLSGVIKSFDKHPMKRLLLLEYYGPYQSSIKTTCPIFVGGACILPSDKGIEAGDEVFVVGKIIENRVGKHLVPRLIADEISRERIT
jgi:hypothetical protein